MLRGWLKTWLSGRPHFVIGSQDDPYLYRWYVLPRNHFLSIYLHKFMRDDDDRALHDHPWWFVSIMVKGGYQELVNTGFIIRRAFSVCFRRATHQHRVVLERDATGKPIPCWTVVITGRKTRTWGFWCPKGFVPWQRFTKAENYGEVGPGCDG